MANWLRNIPFGQRIASMASGQPLENIERTLSAIPEPESKTFGMAVGKALPDIAMATPFMRGAGMIPKIPAFAKTALGLGTYAGTKAAAQKRPILPSAGMGALAGAGFHGVSRLGSTLIPKSIPGAERIGSALGGYATGKILSPQEDKEALFYGAMGGMFPSKRLQPTEQTTKFAKSIVNYALKPSKITKQYGADPTEGIVKEGILGKNWQDTADKVQVRLNELVEYRDRMKIEGNNRNVRVSYTKNKVFKPIEELRSKLAKDPKYHATEIENLDNIIKSLSSENIDLNNMNIDQAYELRDRLNMMKPSGIFNRISQTFISDALHQVYHNMVQAINTSGVSPELKTVNKRMQNLISAEKAINDAKNRNSSAWNLLPMGMFGYGILGGQPWLSGIVAGRAIAKTPFVSTGISKMISKKYPAIK